MTRAVLILCLAGAAGVWAFALWYPKAARLDPLPARFVGTFRLVGFDPPRGSSMQNPLPPGRAYEFGFGADGTYVFSVLGSGSYEMLRQEGVVAVSTAGVLTLTPISMNRVEERAPAERFHVEWGEDKDGPFLALRHVDHGYTFRLR